VAGKSKRQRRETEARQFEHQSQAKNVTFPGFYIWKVSDPVPSARAQEVLGNFTL